MLHLRAPAWRPGAAARWASTAPRRPWVVSGAEGARRRLGRRAGAPTTRLLCASSPPSWSHSIRRGAPGNAVRFVSGGGGAGGEPRDAPDAGEPKEKAKPKDGKEPGAKETPPEEGRNYVLSVEIGVFDGLTMPPRHLLSSFALSMLGYRYPWLWDAQDFNDGVKQAVNTVFECMAQGKPELLEGIVAPELLQRWADAPVATATSPAADAADGKPGDVGSASTGDAADGAKATAEKTQSASEGVPPKDPAAKITGASKADWTAPPELDSVRVLGLLSTGGHVDGEDRRISVSAVFWTKERYQVAGSKPPVEVGRLQCWVFERGINEHDHWTIVDSLSKHWHWH